MDAEKRSYPVNGQDRNSTGQCIQGKLQHYLQRYHEQPSENEEQNNTYNIRQYHSIIYRRHNLTPISGPNTYAALHYTKYILVQVEIYD